ncbi:WD40 repeat domain-containing protein, partial [bacterium]
MLPLALALVAGSPQQPASPRIRVVPQHSSGTLQDLEESRDGSRLLTHDREFAPRLWDARRQIVLANFEGHPDKVANVAFTDDGKRAISRSPKMVILWDAVRAKRISSLLAPAGDAFVASAASKDGSTIALGTQLGSVLLAKGNLSAAKKIGGHSKAVGAFALSRDGARLFSGSEDGTGRVWDAKTGAPLWSVKGNAKGIAWADFSKTGLLATTEYDRKAKGHQKGAVRVWDAKGNPLATYPHWFGSRGVDLTWAGGTFVGDRGDEIVTFDESGSMPIRRIGTEAPVRKLEAHKGAIRELRYSADRRYVSTVAED